MEVITDVIKNCPKQISDEFDEIMNEIIKEHSEKFCNSNPNEYLEYSKGWHYVLAQKILSCKNIKNALDIGALFGVMSVFMSKNGINVTSLDGYVDEIPDSIKIKYGLTFIFANLESEKYPPILPNKFNLVLMSEILEHLNYNPIPVLLIIRKALTKDGYLILNTPDNENYPPVPESPVARNMHHLEIPLWKKDSYRQSFPHSKQYSEKELIEILHNCGFKIKELNRFSYEGTHLLAIAIPDPFWIPTKKVIAIMKRQFPSYFFPRKNKAIINLTIHLLKMTFLIFLRQGPTAVINKVYNFLRSFF